MITHHHRYMSHVPRWGIVPVSRFQSVAEHSYYVSLYVMELLNLPCFDHWDQSRKYCAIKYALIHDVSEARMSDIPGPVKRMIKDPAKYEATERRVVRDMGFVDRYGHDYYVDEDIKDLVKVADLIDETMFLVMELQGGNGHVKILLQQVKDRLGKALASAMCLITYLPDVSSWVEQMEAEISLGLVTLQNDEDVVKAASSVFECDCTHGCHKCDIPF